MNKWINNEIKRGAGATCARPFRLVVAVSFFVIYFPDPRQHPPPFPAPAPLVDTHVKEREKEKLGIATGSLDTSARNSVNPNSAELFVWWSKKKLGKTRYGTAKSVWNKKYLTKIPQILKNLFKTVFDCAILSKTRYSQRMLALKKVKTRYRTAKFIWNKKYLAKISQILEKIYWKLFYCAILSKTRYSQRMLA